MLLVTIDFHPALLIIFLLFLFLFLFLFVFFYHSSIFDFLGKGLVVSIVQSSGFLFICWKYPGCALSCLVVVPSFCWRTAATKEWIHLLRETRATLTWPRRSTMSSRRRWDLPSYPNHIFFRWCRHGCEEEKAQRFNFIGDLIIGDGSLFGLRCRGDSSPISWI